MQKDFGITHLLFIKKKYFLFKMSQMKQTMIALKLKEKYQFQMINGTLLIDFIKNYNYLIINYIFINTILNNLRQSKLF